MQFTQRVGEETRRSAEAGCDFAGSLVGRRCASTVRCSPSQIKLQTKAPKTAARTHQQRPTRAELPGVKVVRRRQIKHALLIAASTQFHKRETGLISAKFPQLLSNHVCYTQSPLESIPRPRSSADADWSSIQLSATAMPSSRFLCILCANAVGHPRGSQHAVGW